jgi:NitT/TauT family transport system substrate-binding protein
MCIRVRLTPRWAPLAVAAGFLLSGCGGSPGVASSPAASLAAKPSAAAAAGAPEKKHMEVASPVDTAGTMPMRIAQDAGYFANHGLDVTVNTVSASVAAQGLTAGSFDLYQGGTTPMTADLAGADLVYVATGVDRSRLAIVAKQGINTFQDLKGKTLAMTSPGAFEDIAIRLTAKQYGIDVDKDFKQLHHPSSTASLPTFLAGNADAIVTSPPYSTTAIEQGHGHVVLDYYQQGLKLPGPAQSTGRAFAAKNPNTVKAYLMGYLDGVKRLYDDPAYAKSVEGKYAKITDQAVLDSIYDDATKIVNKDMRVDPAGIKNVLDGLGTPEAGAADPKRFYDNTLIDAVTRDYAVKLFPDIKL